MEVRQIATGPDDRYVALGAFESTVRLWSFDEQRQVGELETVLDFGGSRLAVTEVAGAPIVVAGAWERHGICGYAVDGNRLWQRSDLGKVQQLAWAGRGDAVAACFDEGPMHVLDALSGKTLSRARGVRRFTQGRFGPFAAADTSARLALVDTDKWEVVWKRPYAGFATLTAALSPDAVTFSDVTDFTDQREGAAGCALSCFTLAGELSWRTELSPAHNCPTLDWDAESSEWVGVIQDPNRRDPARLVRWSARGKMTLLKSLGDVSLQPMAVCSDRRVVVIGDQMVDTRTGKYVLDLSG